MAAEFCTHRSRQGFACALYTGHYGPHKATNVNYQWTTEEEETDDD